MTKARDQPEYSSKRNKEEQESSNELGTCKDAINGGGKMPWGKEGSQSAIRERIDFDWLGETRGVGDWGVTSINELTILLLLYIFAEINGNNHLSNVS